MLVNWLIWVFLLPLRFLSDWTPDFPAPGNVMTALTTSAADPFRIAQSWLWVIGMEQLPAIAFAIWVSGLTAATLKRILKAKAAGFGVG